MKIMKTTIFDLRLGIYIANISQLSKKVASDSLGLVDFAMGLVKSVFNLPDRQVMFFEGFE